MKVDLKEMGPNSDPYLVLTASGVIDAVTVGTLVEKFAALGLSYSSNTAVLADGDMPYVSIKLFKPDAEKEPEVHELPDKFKQEQDRKDGNTTKGARNAS
jgi:hypothetical protein